MGILRVISQSIYSVLRKVFLENIFFKITVIIKSEYYRFRLNDNVMKTNQDKVKIKAEVEVDMSYIIFKIPK